MFRKVVKHLQAEDRLAVLQAADSKRRWNSLDDPRVCIVCDRSLTGRQIDITRDARGRYMLKCPTEGCVSTANDWSYPAAAPAAGRGQEIPAIEFPFFDTNAHRASFG